MNVKQRRELIREYKTIDRNINVMYRLQDKLRQRMIVTCPLEIGDIIELHREVSMRKRWVRVRDVEGILSSRTAGWLARCFNCNKNGRFIGGHYNIHSNSVTPRKVIGHI